MRDANLRWANLKMTNQSEANLSGAQLQGARKSGIDIEAAVAVAGFYGVAGAVSLRDFKERRLHADKRLICRPGVD